MNASEKVFKMRLANLLQEAEITEHEIRESESESMRSMWFGRIDTLRDIIRLADIYFKE